MGWELDHVFIRATSGAPEAQVLIDFGLNEGAARIHPGQGTANRRFFFHNAMFELLWAHDEAELLSPITQPTGLWQRLVARGPDASPFGICLRPEEGNNSSLPFATWDYRPAYLPAPRSIHIGENASEFCEPFIFCLDFARRPDTTEDNAFLGHRVPLREMTSLTLTVPGTNPFSLTLSALAQLKQISICQGEAHLMEIGFDGEKMGAMKDFRPALPLRFRW